MPYFRTDRRNKIYYSFIENAKATDTLVFIHGWAESHKIWRDQITFFQNSYQILTFDLRGFGLSSKPTYGYSLSYHSKILHDLVNSLNLNNYWLIGHSLGGMITLKYCTKYSEEVKGAIVIDTTAYIPRTPSIWLNLGTFFISKTLKQVWEKALKSVRMERRQILLRELIRDSESIPLYVSAACGIAVLNSRIRLKLISCPVLIIVGSNDDLTPVSLSKKMHQILPNSHLAIIADTGHMSFLEKPDEINSIISNFLQSTYNC
ncbi:MAG: alpha/beta fold hydrolase [Candidatus Helarchaeota archaeon]